MKKYLYALTFISFAFLSINNINANQLDFDNDSKYHNSTELILENDTNIEFFELTYTRCGSLAYSIFAVYYGHGYSFEDSLGQAESSYVECNGGSNGWDLVVRDIEERWG